MDVIIGAGISGLTFANFTKRDYLIFEADNIIGGYCKTIKQDGFTWDYSGHFFHFQNKWLEEYLTKNIPIENIVNCKKQTQIYYKDSYIDFPFQKNIHQLEKQEFIDCLYDLFAIKDTDFFNFKEMLYAKFGKSIAEKFLIPYNEKLYACNLNTLDKDAMGRFFPYADKEDIILNFKRIDNNSYNSYFTYSKQGACDYINSLMKNIDEKKVILSEKVLSVDLDKKIIHTNKRQIVFENLISTIPFPKLLNLCQINFNNNIYNWNKVLVFNLGFNKKGKDKINHWVYYPEEKYCFYRVGHYDNILSESRMSLYVELGFKKDEEIDIYFYKQKVLNDLKKAQVIFDEELVSSHHVIMDPAYVHIKQESISDVIKQKKTLSLHNTYSIGRYGSWTYSSIEDNILEAIDLANRLNETH